MYHILGGGFKYCLFSPLPGEEPNSTSAYKFQRGWKKPPTRYTLECRGRCVFIAAGNPGFCSKSNFHVLRFATFRGDGTSMLVGVATLFGRVLLEKLDNWVSVLGFLGEFKNMILIG